MDRVGLSGSVDVPSSLTERELAPPEEDNERDVGVAGADRGPAGGDVYVGADTIKGGGRATPTGASERGVMPPFPPLPFPPLRVPRSLFTRVERTRGGGRATPKGSAT